MADRLISEKRFVDDLYGCLNGFDFELEDVLNVLKGVESVNATPIVHGYWSKATGMMPPEFFGRHICSVCDHFAPNDYYHNTHEWLSPICPNCGAKMDLKEGENNG